MLAVRIVQANFEYSNYFHILTFHWLEIMSPFACYLPFCVKYCLCVCLSFLFNFFSKFSWAFLSQCLMDVSSCHIHCWCDNHLMFCFNGYKFAVYIQEWRLRWRLKLIVVMSMSIRMMAGQNRICVQCAANVLQQNKYWMNTNIYTLMKSCSHVLSVRNVIWVSLVWLHIRMFTGVNTSALNVESVLLTTKS